MTTKYAVKITSDNGSRSYLSPRDRTAWSLRTARKHAREFTARHGGKSEIEPND